jgi:hypothetical protein
MIQALVRINIYKSENRQTKRSGFPASGTYTRTARCLRLLASDTLAGIRVKGWTMAANGSCLAHKDCKYAAVNSQMSVEAGSYCLHIFTILCSFLCMKAYCADVSRAFVKHSCK